MHCHQRVQFPPYVPPALYAHSVVSRQMCFPLSVDPQINLSEGHYGGHKFTQHTLITALCCSCVCVSFLFLSLDLSCSGSSHAVSGWLDVLNYASAGDRFDLFLPR